MGPGAWLIARDPFPQSLAKTSVHMRCVSLTDGDIRPFADQVGDWLDRHYARAVLVRPDRYIFGTGTPTELIREFTTAMTDPLVVRPVAAACN
jgi:3-(3-hydroxy-phenyl)propionate hydroxylase